MQQWREGERRLARAGRTEARVLERVTQRIVEDLRRRLGGTFSVDELVALYDEGTGWAEGLAMEVAPEDPWAWDAQTVVEAAFGRYLRDASDYAGGRRLAPAGRRRTAPGRAGTPDADRAAPAPPRGRRRGRRSRARLPAPRWPPGTPPPRPGRARGVRRA